MAGLLSWGVADYLAASTSGRIGSLSTAFFVQLFGLALPLPFAALELASGSAEVDWGALAVWATLSASFLGLAYLAYYTGLQRGPVSVVTTAASAWLAVTVVVAVVLFGDSVTAEQAALMAVILAGIVMLSLRRSSATAGGGGLWWGLLAMFGLGAALAFFARATDAGGAMLAVLVVRTLSLIPTYLFIRSRGEPLRLPSNGAGWRLLLGASVLDAGGYVGYNLGLEVASVALVAPIVGAHPLATVALAVVLLRERPRALQWAGGAVIVSAVVALSALWGG